MLTGAFTDLTPTSNIARLFGPRCIKGVFRVCGVLPMPEGCSTHGKVTCSFDNLPQVIRIQPNESIYLKINNKVPGLGLRLDTTKLDLSYR